MADNGGVAEPSPPARPRARRSRLALLTAALAVVAGVVGVVPARLAPVGAQETEVIDDPRLDPSLAGVQVQSDGYEKARAAYRAAASALADSRDRLGHLEQDLAELGTERGRLEAELADARTRNDAARAEFDRHRASLRSLAVRFTYVIASVPVLRTTISVVSVMRTQTS